MLPFILLGIFGILIVILFWATYKSDKEFDDMLKRK